MNEEARIYLLHVWRVHGRWRIAMRLVGEDRVQLFTRAEQVSEFISEVTSGAVAVWPGGRLAPDASAPVSDQDAGPDPRR